MIETLCFLSADRFAKIKGLFYRPSKTLLNTLYDYLVLVDTQTDSEGLEHSDSKSLLKNLKKAQRITVDEESEDEGEREERLQAHETPEKKSDRTQQPVSNEKFMFTASLIAKLLMTCTTLVNSEFAAKATIYLLRSSYQNLELTLRTMINNFKIKEILEDNPYINYWRYVDEVILRLYEENDLKRACDFAKLVSKIWNEKNDSLPEDKKTIVGEKYLKYLINIIILAISSIGKYDLLTVAITLANKSYLDASSYKKILAFFEVISSFLKFMLLG